MEGTVILAGVAPGFGAALVGSFLDAGYRVDGLSRRADPGADEDAGRPGYRHHMCDVTDADMVARTVAAISGEREVVGLVYNPAMLVISPFADLTPALFEASWRSGCLGAMIMAQAVLPKLEASGGTMIFTGATASLRGGSGFAAFASAKFALRALAQSLAREYGPRGVHVVHTVLDGLIDGPQSRARFPSVPTERCLDPRSVARTYVELFRQPQGAWTHELDLRPSSESF